MKTYYLTRWEQMHGIVQMQYKVEAESEESVKDGKFEVIEAEQLALEIDDIEILAAVIIMLIEIKPPRIIAIKRSILAILRSSGFFHFSFIRG